MRPVSLDLSQIRDQAVVAALQEIMRASNDTLQNDTSSSGAAMATLVGATLGSGSPEVAYFPTQFTTAFAPITPFGLSLLGATKALTWDQNLSRDMTAANGNVAYTGIGFKPSMLLGLGYISTSQQGCMGVDDGVNPRVYFNYGAGNTWNQSGGAFVIFSADGFVTFQGAKVASFDADGFTLTWTKTGAPAAGTAMFSVLAFR